MSTYPQRFFMLALIFALVAGAGAAAGERVDITIVNGLDQEEESDEKKGNS